MCSECLQYPCHPRCPNAPEPRAIHKCAYCDEGIIAGDEMVEYGGNYYHADCIREMTIGELAEVFDFKITEAQEDIYE